MKKFFGEHSYNMVKMLLNQFATAIFGFVLFLATKKAKNIVLMNVTSVAAILFYLFLLYTMTWEIGYRDKVSVEQGRKKKNVFTGALISLCANIPNFIYAIFIMLAILIDVGEGSLIANIGGICSFLALFLEGMFTGVLANHVGGVSLGSHWFMFFLIPLPAILVCGVAYYLGLRDIKFTSLFDPVLPESDRDPSNKKRR